MATHNDTNGEKGGEMYFQYKTILACNLPCMSLVFLSLSNNFQVFLHRTCLNLTLHIYFILCYSMQQLYQIQKFIFSLSRVFHVATATLRAIRTHVRASVDRNTLQ